MPAMPTYPLTMHAHVRSILVGTYTPKASPSGKFYFPLKLLAFNLLASCTESESEPLEGCRATLR